MGPQVILAIFKQVFEDAPDVYKYALAPGAFLWLTDARAKLDCLTETCDDLEGRKDAADYMLATIVPYLPIPT